ncbi:MAG: GNAT family N-acetyltransferase [Burkholderiales bacterium]|nr:GNAT family N-acetyltransferase [Burkholderiales bacterium]
MTRKVIVYRHPSDFPTEVAALFERAANRELEMSAPWHANLIDAVFQGEDSPAIYVLVSDGQARAAVALLHRRKWWGHELRSMANFYTSYSEPLLAEDAGLPECLALLDGIRSQHKRLVSLYLGPLDPDSPASVHWKAALESRRYACFLQFRFANWYLPTNGDWESYLAERDSQIRNTLKRKQPKFLSAGGRLQVYRNLADLDDALSAYQHVYAKSWKRPEPYPQFIPGLLRCATEQGWLRLGIATLHGTPIAAQIWLVNRGRAAIFKLAYDEAFKSYSAGSLLTAHLMQEVMSNDGVREVDYLIGNDAYKQGWMSHRRDRKAIQAFNLQHPVGCFGAVRELLADQTRPLREWWRQLSTRSSTEAASK